MVLVRIAALIVAGVCAVIVLLAGSLGGAGAKDLLAVGLLALIVAVLA